MNLPYIARNIDSPAAMPEATLKNPVEEARRHRAMFPDIYFKLEPFIASTCEAIESSGVMPTQQEMDSIIDEIFDDFCNMHPDMANYMRSNDSDNSLPEAVPTQVFFGRPGRFRGFRRRGLGRDLIALLLLERLFRRRRPFHTFNPYPYPY